MTDETQTTIPADATETQTEVTQPETIETPAAEEVAETEEDTVLVEFHGDPAATPLSGSINGEAWAYPYGEPVAVPLHIFAIIEASGAAFALIESLPSDASVTPSEGAAQPDETGQGDAGNLSVGGSDNPGVNLESILDGNVASILEAIPTLPVEHLQWLLTAERNGKTRKTVIEALCTALDIPADA